MALRASLEEFDGLPYRFPPRQNQEHHLDTAQCEMLHFSDVLADTIDAMIHVSKRSPVRIFARDYPILVISSCSI